MQSVKQENFFPVSSMRRIQIPVMRNVSSLCVCVRACLSWFMCPDSGLCRVLLPVRVCDSCRWNPDSYRLQILLFPAAVQLLHSFNNMPGFLSDEEESWNLDQTYNLIIVDFFSIILRRKRIPKKIVHHEVPLPWRCCLPLVTWVGPIQSAPACGCGNPCDGRECRQTSGSIWAHRSSSLFLSFVYSCHCVWGGDSRLWEESCSF